MSFFSGTILVLGVLISVHEWGHFIVARLFGVRVDVFSIGFGPRLFGIKRGTTDYRVSAVPLGGYVRMAGQDLSEVDSGGQAPTGASDELTSKPRWQRVLISLAGPAVNLILPVLLFGGFYWVRGTPYPAYVDQAAMIAGISQNDPLAKLGAVQGDRIIAVNGVDTPTWESVYEQVSHSSADVLRVSIEHRGTSRVVEVLAKDLKDAKSPGSYAPVPPLVHQISKGQAAHHAGMKSGDLVVSVNDVAIANWPQFVDIIQHSNGSLLKVAVQRKGELLTLNMRPEWLPDEDGKYAYRLGVLPKLDLAYKKVPFATAFVDATDETWASAKHLLAVVSKLFTGRLSVSQLQGVVGIADQAGQAVQGGMAELVNLMALMSLNLGILNLLPIPILDGGNILLLAIEGSIRRDMSMSFKERFVQVGLVFLLVIFAIVMYNDVKRRLPVHSSGRHGADSEIASWLHHPRTGFPSVSA